MAFRDRLLATIRAARPVLELPDILVVGSEVPNLLEPGAAATLVVSQDLDIGVPVARHGAVKQRLHELVGLLASADEPSVFVPSSRDGMPDPRPHRADVAQILRRLEAVEPEPA